MAMSMNNERSVLSLTIYYFTNTKIALHYLNGILKVLLNS